MSTPVPAPAYCAACTGCGQHYADEESGDYLFVSPERMERCLGADGWQASRYCARPASHPPRRSPGRYRSPGWRDDVRSPLRPADALVRTPRMGRRPR